MRDIVELSRLASPAERPQSLCWDGSTLWMGSLATKLLYAIDPKSWTVKWEVEAPGAPFGMAAVGDELRVICGETDDDNRFIRRCAPFHGFDAVFRIPCPDDTGSQLGWDGALLHVSQWYNKRVLAIDERGAVVREIPSPHEICGQVIVDGVLYLLGTDDESTDDYFLTRLDLRSETPKAEDLARVPFPGRALAFDGQHFWTNHRSAHEIVRFSLPGA